ncbi:MAG: hypothetical protein JSR58_04770 [Verrucomicrobia bacterium]|nr:hypothetical protein [Verrucomicrobiota bacterium]
MTTTTSVSTISQMTLVSPQSVHPFEGFPSLIHELGQENGTPYLLCNEERQDASLNQLLHSVRISDPQAVHLGFSVWFNLDLIAQTKPSRAIICDIDPYVIKLYAAFGEAFKRCDSALDFALEMNRYIIGKSFMHYDFKQELVRKGSWLSSDKTYDHVRQMYLQGRINFGYLNLADREGKFQAISQWLRQKGLYIQTLYISNIFVWLKKTNLQTLSQGSANIHELLDHRTQTIHAFSPEGNEKNSLVQEVVGGLLANNIANTIWNLNYKPEVKVAFDRRMPPPRFRLDEDE